ncbi:MAG: glycosyltransferase, partial [Nitrososphaerota archaeon]|nr:glycosyltransferase [Nitrososphaerota archaeon]
MRIAFFCDEYPGIKTYSGGIGTFVKLFGHALADRGHEVYVIGFGPEYRELSDGQVRIILLKERKVPKLSWLINRLSLWLFIRKLSQKDDIDIVEIPEWCGMLPFPSPFVPVVVRLHSSIVQPSKVLHLLEKLTLAFHRDWIAVSAWQGQD